MTQSKWFSRLTLISAALLLCVPFAVAQDQQKAAPAPAATTQSLRAAPSVAGTGTLNFITKWNDAAGTLVNSSIFDDGNNVAIGTNSPGGVFDCVRPSSADILMRIWNNGAAGAKLRYVAATGATSQLQLTDYAEWLSAIAGNNTGLYFRVRGSGTTNSEAQLNSSTRLTILRNGNVGIGTATPAALLHVAGNAQIDGNIAAKYQDIAEWVPATDQMEPGTVVILNPEKKNEVMKSNGAYDTRVAGVVSGEPGILLGESSDSKAAVATTGRVRVWVDATKYPVKVGDLLVSSDTPGMAMLSQPVDIGGVKLHRPGTIIGKALEALPSGRGEILVLLALQ